jgi:drug/metabolite transporter (DMT)-like permease
VTRSAQSPGLGLALLLVAMAAFAVSDAAAKHLSSTFSPFALAWFRYVALLLIVLPISMHRPALWKSGQPLRQLARGIVTITSTVLFLGALRLIPQAEATAMVFASPLFVLVLARVMLKERVGVRRVAPVLVGFAGVLVVARPGSLHFGGAEFLPFASSMAWALSVVLTRKLHETDHILTTLLYSAVIGVAGLSVSAPGVDLQAAGTAWPMLAVMAAAWCASQWLVIAAYRVASPSAIAPYSYSQLLWAAVLGWAVADHWPDAVSWLGMSLIFGSAAYAAWRRA